LPNLLVPELVEAIASRQVPRIYVCNIMMEPGETQGFRYLTTFAPLMPPVDAILFDAVLVQKVLPSSEAIAHYAEQEVGPVLLDRDAVISSGRRIIAANVMEERDNLTVRHHPHRLARVLLRWYSKTQFYLTTLVPSSSRMAPWVLKKHLT
jgi:uncharacterized cofD-like protein